MQNVKDINSMESLYILIPTAIVIVAIAVAIFFWAVKSGQFEDLDTEGKRILFDEQPNTKAKPSLENNNHDGNKSHGSSQNNNLPDEEPPLSQ